MIAYSVLFIIFSSLKSPVFSDEDFYQVKACCSFKGPNFEHAEYKLLSSFNKRNMMEYNSTRGYWIGFTSYSITASHYWNRDPYDAIERAFERKLLCYDNTHYIQSIGNLSTTPTISLKSVKQSDGQHPAILVCSAYNFYPKQIKLTWMQNDQEVIDGVTHTDAVPDGDLYYQYLSYLEYSPTSGDKISCMIEYFTLLEPKTIVWDDSLPKEEITKIVVGLCGLVPGLVVLISGFIYYKKKSAIYASVCQGRVGILMECHS